MPIKLFYRVSYDAQVDACYISMVDVDRVDDTIETSEGFFVDLDKEGKILGLEILDASHHYDYINTLLFSSKPIQECISF